MKKAFDQTIRDLKREVNKKVLKLPSVEQKILDATSNEPWGPHGSLLVDIAHATRIYPEYQMIMTVIWKRINSTGKNWRHVYKGLTVLEYLAANGSERVIDEIREHAYQISTLSNFQYIDSSGRDQGLNVRRKSESLVSLVNDKEKIQEVREKAAANRDKFNSGSSGGIHGPGSYSGSGYGDRYDDERNEGRYGSRDEERNGYGREGERSRDDDRYGRYADPYARDSDRNSRDSEERYGRGGYKEDDYRGRYGDENLDGSRSSEREKDRSYDDEHHSSRGSSVKAEDHPQEGRPIDRKFSEQSVAAPPSYEDAVGSKSPVSSGRDVEIPPPPVPKASSPTTSPSPGQTTAEPSSSWSDPKSKAETVGEFDPRCSQDAAVSGTSNNAETDLLGSLSDAWAITPVSSAMTSEDPSASGPFSESNFMATDSSTTTVNQSFEDPFGDSPFKAYPSSDDVTTQAHNFASVSSFQPPAVNTVEQVQQVAQMANNFGNSGVSEPLSGLTYSTPDASTFQIPQNSQPIQQEPLSFQNDDILAGILPPPAAASQTPFLPSANQPIPVYNASNYAYNAPNFGPRPGYPPADTSPFAAQNLMMPFSQNSGINSLPHSTPASVSSNTAPQMPFGMVPQETNGILGDSLPQAGPTISYPSQPTSTPTAGSLALVSQPPKEKFEPKSAVWADTLSRGLVNFNISGAKVNPNADIGVDFANLNRKEKRMEKPTTSSVTSTVTMGKAMGSGSGIGRSGTSMPRPQPNHLMGPGMGMGGAPGVGMGMGMGMGGAPGAGMGMGGVPGVGMGMGMGGAPGAGMGMGGAPGAGMGMGGYGMMSQRPNMGMGPGTGVGGNVGMGMGQGVPMQPSNGLQPGSNMPGGYNPMMGRGGYPQNPYGSGYQ